MASGWVGQRCWTVAGLAAALVVGSWLRLAWVRDIEYKADEAWTFERTQQVGVTEPWPWLGMDSSTQVVNPGLSVWVFLGLSRLGDVDDPTTLARAVQLLNIGALIIVVWFAVRVVAPAEREPWLWGAALGAVNPLAVLFQRKIWPPSIFPIVTMVMLLGWWRRERRWGAFLWGLVGACLGQIHMSGFFFAGGFALWAVLFDRKGTRWGWWLAGSALGALALLPWLGHILAGSNAHEIIGHHWYHSLEGKFWGRWITEPLGLSVEYALERDFGDFLAYPLIGGHKTYGMMLLHGMILASALLLVVRLLPFLWQNRTRWREAFLGQGSTTAFTMSAAWWGFGLLLSLAGVSIHRHYLIILFPLTFVWLARAALAHSDRFAGAVRLGRGLLLALCLAQVLIAIGFLGYVHANQRRLRGDYGTPYGAQGGSGLTQRGSAQAFDDAGNSASGFENFGLGQERTEAKAHGGVEELLRNLHGLQEEQGTAGTGGTR
jgi:hypothetical protein